MSDPSTPNTVAETPPAEPPAAPKVGAGFDLADPNSPLAPYYFRSVHVWAVALIGVVFVFASVFPLWHTDVWGHVRYGQWMVQNGKIPDRELFCPWWDGRVPFTQFYTVTQVVMYWAYACGAWLAGGDAVSQMTGGVEVLRSLHALLTAGRFAVLMYVFLRLSKSWGVSLLGLLAVISLDLSNLAVFRPQTFAQLFFALLLLPLSRETLSRRAVWLVPLLVAFWANAHGSFIVALVMLGAVFFGRCLELFPTAPWRDLHAKRLLLALVLSVIAVGVLNPYGPSFYLRTFEMTKHPSLAAIGEWKPLEFEWAKGWHWVFMLSLLVIAGTQLKTAAFPARFAVPLLLFGVGVSLQTRFVIWWAMVVPWVLVPRWAELAKLWPEKWKHTSVPTFRKTGLAALVAWAMAMWSGAGGWAAIGTPTPIDQSISSGTPWKLARQLKNPDDPDARAMPRLAEVVKERYGGKFRGTVMATPMQGDFLMWAIAPDIPVTYSHIHLFHPDYWQELGLVGQGAPGWWDVLDKYRVNLLVVEAEYAAGLKAELLKSKEWEILLDEAGDPTKPNPLTRQLIAVRLNPR